MAKAKKTNLIGSWAFLLGVILAIVLGAMGVYSVTVAWILVILGVIVGLLNIAAEETTPFLMSGAVLIIASALGGGVVGIIPVLQGIVSSLLLIFVPATIIVAIKNVFVLARR